MQWFQRVLCVLSVLAAVLVTGSARAEEISHAEPTSASWLSIIIAVILAIAVGVGSFINPKRSHQD